MSYDYEWDEGDEYNYYREESIKKQVNKLNIEFMPKWKAFAGHDSIIVWSNDQTQDFCLVSGTHKECRKAILRLEPADRIKQVAAEELTTREALGS